MRKYDRERENINPSKLRHNIRGNQREDSLEREMSSMSVDKRNKINENGDRREKYVTNYVKIETGRKEVHKYSVSYSPDIDSSSLRYGLLRQHDDIVGEFKCFDGTILYIVHRLAEDNMILESVTERDDKIILIRIRYLDTMLLSETPHLVSVVMKRILRYINLQRIGQGYYCSDLKINIDAYNLSLWPGYNTALRTYDGGIMWSIEPSFKVLRRECAIDVMSDLYFRSKDFQRDVTRTFVGSVIMTRYNNKTYRIDDIAWDKSPKDKFEWRNGQQISYVEYYKQIYGLTITDTDQPLFINIPKANNKKGANPTQSSNQLTLICLIPEFCFLTGINDVMREDQKLMKDLSRSFHSSANEKLKSIRSLVDLVLKNENAQKELKFWGIRITSSMHEVEGITYAPEPIYDGSSSKPIAHDATKGFMNSLKCLQPLSCPKLQDWIVVHTQRDTSAVDRFMKSLEQAVRSCNLAFLPPKLVPIPSDSTDAYIKAIRGELSQCSDLDLVMCVFPTQREDRYAAFKKLLCVQFAIPSQAVLTRTILNPGKLNTVSNRIALQMNCKLGGELWHVHIPMKGIMAIGIDVYHGSANNRSSSVVGFVSSLNDKLTKWFSRVAFQAQSNEMVESLRSFILQALAKYYDMNHSLPTKIIVFRDGVGVGNVSALEELEIQPLLDAIASFSDDYNPQLLFTLIHKRIRTRIFSHGERGGFGNPPPGSVIDTSITSGTFPNFFLVSQNFSQGTVQPINIVVVYNSTKLSLEQIQRLTYKCTYLYYNWPGAVRVPAPCLYAHRVAFVAGQYLHSDASPALADKLYFL